MLNNLCLCSWWRKLVYGNNGCGFYPDTVLHAFLKTNERYTNTEKETDRQGESEAVIGVVGLERLRLIVVVWGRVVCGPRYLYNSLSVTRSPTLWMSMPNGLYSIAATVCMSFVHMEKEQLLLYAFPKKKKKIVVSLLIVSGVDWQLRFKSDVNMTRVAFASWFYLTSISKIPFSNQIVFQSIEVRKIVLSVQCYKRFTIFQFNQNWNRIYHIEKTNKKKKSRKTQTHKQYGLREWLKFICGHF